MLKRNVGNLSEIDEYRDKLYEAHKLINKTMIPTKHQKNLCFKLLISFSCRESCCKPPYNGKKTFNF